MGFTGSARSSRRPHRAAWLTALLLVGATLLAGCAQPAPSLSTPTPPVPANGQQWEEIPTSAGVLLWKPGPPFRTEESVPWGAAAANASAWQALWRGQQHPSEAGQPLPKPDGIDFMTHVAFVAAVRSPTLSQRLGLVGGWPEPGGFVLHVEHHKRCGAAPQMVDHPTIVGAIPRHLFGDGEAAPALRIEPLFVPAADCLGTAWANANYRTGHASAELRLRAAPERAWGCALLSGALAARGEVTVDWAPRTPPAGELAIEVEGAGPEGRPLAMRGPPPLATGVFPTWPGSVLVSGESALAAGQDVRIGYRALYLGDRDLEFTHLLATPSRDRPHGCDSLR